jgi:GAF domain-containing protein
VEERYQRIVDQLAELIAKTDDPAAHRATAVALLHHKIPGVSWTGFYYLKDGELVVDAYQGPVACLVLEQHVGVCWAAIDTDQTQIIRDVHAFPGHIPCDDRSRSKSLSRFTMPMVARSASSTSIHTRRPISTNSTERATSQS